VQTGVLVLRRKSTEEIALGLKLNQRVEAERLS
jgi:hypothetical protein